MLEVEGNIYQEVIVVWQLSRNNQVAWDVSAKDAEGSVSEEPISTANKDWGLPGAHESPADSGRSVF